jgi:cyclic pyranopterin phosphate synthase
MLQDSFSRKFSYLRLSLTEVCNFSCQYCLPNGFQRSEAPLSPELKTEEVRRLLIGFRQAGFSKVRFTGGEPTIRSDLPEIISMAREVGFEKRALSTNGWNLKRILPTLKSSGLSHLNVSVDSLDPARFQKLTGKSLLPQILDGIQETLAAGGIQLKLNAVLHRETALLELKSFQDFVKDRPISFRFIELMRTLNRGEYRDRHYASAGELRFQLLSQGWELKAREGDSGPALVFAHPNYQGTIGLISPHSDGFCSTCNRLRVTSRGNLRLCLFGDQDYSLREFLQDDSGPTQLATRLPQLIQSKPESHFLHRNESGQLKQFSELGG